MNTKTKIYKFKSYVYETPFAPFYDDYYDHFFEIVNEPCDVLGHVELRCTDDPTVIVDGIVEYSDLELVKTHYKFYRFWLPILFIIIWDIITFYIFSGKYNQKWYVETTYILFGNAVGIIFYYIVRNIITSMITLWKEIK
jgi:hypothetical protein